MSEPRFGDRVRSIYAGETNPRREGFYVETIRRRGRLNPGKHYRITDGAGDFWETPADSVHPVESGPTVEASEPEGEVRSTCPCGEQMELQWVCEQCGYRYSAVSSVELRQGARRWAAVAPEQAEERTPQDWLTLCVACGPNVAVDEDGCCVECGATAMGEWLMNWSFRALRSHSGEPRVTLEQVEKAMRDEVEHQIYLGTSAVVKRTLADFTGAVLQRLEDQ